jgi:hypothetical protein
MLILNQMSFLMATRPNSEPLQGAASKWIDDLFPVGEEMEIVANVPPDSSPDRIWCQDPENHHFLKNHGCVTCKKIGITDAQCPYKCKGCGELMY